MCERESLHQSLPEPHNEECPGCDECDPNRANPSLCKCGHPREAHRLNYNGPADPAGRATGQLSCSATITRRHEQGDDSWPCTCRDFREVSE